MNIIVTMAGQSRRFAESGVTIPKWALSVGGRTVLARAVDSLNVLFERGATCTFVALRDQSHLTHLATCRAELSWPSSLVLLDETPPGQALTALAGCQALDPSEPIAIWNVDTMVEPEALESAPNGGNWLTLCAQGGTHWSFARVEDGVVTETAEKRRISKWASVGLYGFESAEMFESVVANVEPDQSLVNGELYVAPLYNKILNAGRQVLPHFIDGSALTALGTPAEVMASCQRHGWPIPDELAHR